MARAMALPTFAISHYRTPIKLFKDQPCHLHNPTLLHTRRQISPTSCSIKVTNAESNEPNKFKMQVNILKTRLWETVPEPVKEFPWKKAQDTLLHQLMYFGKKALKWSLLTLFILSFSSDIVISFSRNKELMLPIGLFVGCMMTDFLKETSQELFRNSQEMGLDRQLLGIGCFFVLVKFVSTYFSVRGQIFLLHVGNGGLMQVLWLWRSFQEERGNVENTILSQDPSTDMTVDE